MYVDCECGMPVCYSQFAAMPTVGLLISPTLEELPGYVKLKG